MERKALEIKDVKRTLNKKDVLKNINLTVHASEIAALIGPTGSGKSLLLRALVNLVKIDSGKILYFGHDITKERDYIMNFVGYKPKETQSWNHLSTLNYFKLSSKFYEGQYLDNALSLIDKFHIAHDTKLKDLSTEQRSLISVIDALYFNPEIIILDEPFLNLSNDSRCLLEQMLIEEKKKGKAVLITCSNLNDIDFVDNIFLIKDGEILNSSISEKIKREYKLVYISSEKGFDIGSFKLKNIKSLEFSIHHVKFLFEGEMNALISILNKLSVNDLTIVSPSLEDIFKVI